MTVTIFGLECDSTKKAKNWFRKNGVPFVERNIIKKPITVSELQDILRMTEDGTDGIISTRSKAYRDLNLDFDELSLQELLEIIHDHPRLLRSPIIVDEKRLQIGYQAEEIRQFLPRKTRRTQWSQLLKMNKLNLIEDSF